MNKNPDKTPRWATSSFSSAPDASPKEIAALGEHLQNCNSERESLFGLRATADAVNQFAAPRLITILIVFAVVSVIASLVI
jgi:hypothetical protein